MCSCAAKTKDFVPRLRKRELARTRNDDASRDPSAVSESEFVEGAERKNASKKEKKGRCTLLRRHSLPATEARRGLIREGGRLAPSVFEDTDALADAVGSGKPVHL